MRPVAEWHLQDTAMAGKLIPFPQTSQSTTHVAQGQSLLQGFEPQVIPDDRGIHLVPPAAPVLEMASSITQHRAIRIVEEIKRLQEDMPLASEPAIFNQRSPQFWATLPVPDSTMDTPLTIARRLVHLLVSSPA